MDLRKISHEGVKWTEMAMDKALWKASGMNLWVSCSRIPYTMKSVIQL